MKQVLRNSVALLALTGALALTANQALAGGFSVREQSSEGQGAGGFTFEVQQLV